jgi:hypothetical protein
MPNSDIYKGIAVPNKVRVEIFRLSRCLVLRLFCPHRNLTGQFDSVHCIVLNRRTARGGFLFLGLCCSIMIFLTLCSSSKNWRKNRHPVHPAGEPLESLSYLIFRVFSDLNTGGQDAWMCDTGKAKVPHIAEIFTSEISQARKCGDMQPVCSVIL